MATKKLGRNPFEKAAKKASLAEETTVEAKPAKARKNPKRVAHTSAEASIHPLVDVWTDFQAQLYVFQLKLRLLLAAL
jgi:hypothetical protein